MRDPNSTRKGRKAGIAEPKQLQKARRRIKAIEKGMPEFEYKGPPSARRASGRASHAFAERVAAEYLAALSGSGFDPIEAFTSDAKFDLDPHPFMRSGVIRHLLLESVRAARDSPAQAASLAGTGRRLASDGDARHATGGELRLRAHADAAVLNAQRLQGMLKPGFFKILVEYNLREAKGRYAKEAARVAAEYGSLGAPWENQGIGLDFEGDEIRARLLGSSLYRSAGDFRSADLQLCKAVAELGRLERFCRTPLRNLEGREVLPLQELIEAAQRAVSRERPRYIILEGLLQEAMGASDSVTGEAGLIEDGGDPFLRAVAIVNRADRLSRGNEGERQQAGMYAAEGSEYVAAHGGAVNSLRLASITARSKGDLVGFVATIPRYVDLGAALDSTLVLLEAACMFAERGDIKSCAALAPHVPAILSVHGITRQAVAALLLFRQSLDANLIQPAALSAIRRDLMANQQRHRQTGM
jgi:hypothetical protein